MLARRVATAVGVAAVAVAIAAGSANATAMQTHHAQDVTAATGDVLVKTVTTANGTLKVFKESAQHHSAATTLAPNSSTGCSGSNPEVCLSIHGSGLYVQYMENKTDFRSAGNADMQINGPSGVIADSGWFYETGGGYFFDWSPYDYVAAGYYCATTFVGGGRQGACETVHN